MGVLKLDGSGLPEVRLIYMYAKLRALSAFPNIRRIDGVFLIPLAFSCTEIISALPKGVAIYCFDLNY
jgi:hypothetical protein